MAEARPRVDPAFLALIAAQAAHSTEEFYGRLYESFAPARFVSGLFSDVLARGFVIGNVLLVAFGAWCFAWPVRRRWPSATAFGVIWIAVELLNGVGHLLRSLLEWQYTPGVATAPLLLVAAAYLALQLSDLRKEKR